MFIKCFRVGPVVTNCYVLGDEVTKMAALIDPGDHGKRLALQVMQDGYQLEMILLTHGHFDHISGVSGVLEEAERLYPGKEIPVYIHQEDYPCSSTNFHMDVSLSGTPGIRYYADGDTVQLGELTIEVIGTPGHTKGGVCLKVEDALFTGDTLFCGSCGRTDFRSSSPQQMLQSLKKLALIPGDYEVYPGHEAPTTLEEERSSNPYMMQAMRR